ncbi:MAG: HAMP domain-containing protein, partial [Bernardetiaceae bacterium]|nr:HAMP domain-containing protein [Bernardetiaceae bacterium]
MLVFSRIKYRLLFYLLLVGVVPLIATMLYEYASVASTLRQRTFDQLTTVREIKKRRVEDYFAQIRHEIAFFAKSSTVIEATKEFKTAFSQLAEVPVPAEYPQQLRKYYQDQVFAKVYRPTCTVDQVVPRHPRTQFLQGQYLVSNRSQLLTSPYHAVHDKHHPTIANFLKTYGYYDVFLIDDEHGDIVYTVAKEIDFATNLLHGPFADSNLGRLFRKMRLTGVETQVTLCDFETYLPSYQAPAAFIGAPIFDGDKKIGTLVFQIPIDRIDAVMTGNGNWVEEGLGESGESYIVGQDRTMRTNSRFIIESPEQFVEQAKAIVKDTNALAQMSFYQTTVLFNHINTEGVQLAFANKRDTRIIDDYRHVEVLSSFTPLNIPDVRWVLLAEIDAAEAFAPVQEFALRSLWTVLGTTVLIVLLAFLIAAGISRPINKLAAATAELDKGNLDVQVSARGRDEIGALGRSFNSSVRSLKHQRDEIVQKQIELEQQKQEIEAQADNLREMNEHMMRKNAELEQQKEEILAQRDDILQKTTALEQQQEELLMQAENLKQVNQNVATKNSELEQQAEEIKAQRDQLLETQKAMEQQQQELQAQAENLREVNQAVATKNRELEQQAEEIKAQRDQLLDTQKVMEQQQQELQAQGEYLRQANDRMAEQNLALEKQKLAISEQATSLQTANDHVQHMYQEMVEQQKLIEKKNADITASLNYASRIQGVMLAPLAEIRAHLPQSFVFYQPKDIVSGDFYWFARVQNQGRERLILAAVDCTGHGVPGAFMSLIGQNLLHEIVKVGQITRPEQILAELHRQIRSLLKQDTTTNRDGMEAAICTVDLQARTLQFAGAGFPLLYVRRGQAELVKGDAHHIGGMQKEAERRFVGHEIALDPDHPTTFYIYSDGFQDQFGGPDYRKYMSKHFRAYLQQISELPLAQQEAQLR